MATLVAFGMDPVPLDEAVLAAKQAALFENLKGLDTVIVAYSGGTDSAFLAWAAAQVLGDKAVAVTANSPSMPESHKRDAAEYARQCGFRHESVLTNEFDNPDYVKNGADRCFHCKDELFTRLEEVAHERGVRHILYGVNQDDLGDYRPGQQAAKIHEVKAPLAEAGLRKVEIRELARRAGLPFWNRPAAACLSSRVPYGTPVTVKTIQTIEAGEEAMRELGFQQFRVRFHEKLVRLEIDRAELPRALDMEMAGKLAAIFRPLGFHYVTLDLEGYRQGSLNAALGMTPIGEQKPGEQ